MLTGPPDDKAKEDEKVEGAPGLTRLSGCERLEPYRGFALPAALENRLDRRQQGLEGWQGRHHQTRLRSGSERVQDVESGVPVPTQSIQLVSRYRA